MEIRAFLAALLTTGLLITMSGYNAFSQTLDTSRKIGPQIEPHAVLPHYVSTPDSNYQWALIQQSDTDKGTFLQLSLVSQQWRNRPWRHQLFVFFPAIQSSAATIFLSLQMGFEVNQAHRGLWQAAQATGVPCAILCDVPNQPLFDGKQEEELLNYTFEQYLQTGEPTWPLLLPMVKGVVRAMDALQEISKRHDVPRIKHFVIAGHSKRGHTAWLTAAVDKRVSGLIAQGFNTLNSSAQIPHYLSTYGELDQSALAAKNVIKQINTPRGQSLIQIVDAYTYRDRLTQPKLIIVGTNDDYTPVDALNLYWSGLLGFNSILSLPNAGHVGATNDARHFPTAYAFIQAVANGERLPTLQSRLQQTKGKIKLVITTNKSASTARIWTAHSLTKDFRSAQWVAQPVSSTAGSIPPKGHESKRFMIELTGSEPGYIALIGEVEFNRQPNLRFSLSTTPYVIESR